MYRESKYDFIIYNGKVVSKNDNLYSGVDDHPIVYEVIRIMDGVPLYYKEHFERMKISAAMMGFDLCCDEEAVLNEIKMLITETNECNQNIKLLYTKFEGKFETFVYFINSYYPENHVYNEGVNTVLYHDERTNPNAKVLNRKLKENIEKIREETQVYEALLVNKQMEITEGSRSNVFFVKGDTVFTAISNDVLEGITRKKVIELMKKHHIKMVEEKILASEIMNYDGAFLTGTSINILPIKKIDDYEINSSNSEMVQKLMKYLNSDIAKYIEENKDVK